MQSTYPFGWNNTFWPTTPGFTNGFNPAGWNPSFNQPFGGYPIGGLWNNTVPTGFNTPWNLQNCQLPTWQNVFPGISNNIPNVPFTGSTTNTFGRPANGPFNAPFPIAGLPFNQFPYGVNQFPVTSPWNVLPSFAGAEFTGFGGVYGFQTPWTNQLPFGTQNTPWLCNSTLPFVSNTLGLPFGVTPWNTVPVNSPLNVPGAFNPTVGNYTSGVFAGQTPAFNTNGYTPTVPFTGYPTPTFGGLPFQGYPTIGQYPVGAFPGYVPTVPTNTMPYAQSVPTGGQSYSPINPAQAHLAYQSSTLCRDAA
jgi:hypothetical protein